MPLSSLLKIEILPQSYRLVISPPGSGINSLEKRPGETTASFYGLVAQSTYTINVTAEAKRADASVHGASAVCSTGSML